MEAGPAVVECYSGGRYGERPVALDWEGKRHRVSRVERRWREPQGLGFEVWTEEGLRFQLRYREADDIWIVTPIWG